VTTKQFKTLVDKFLAGKTSKEEDEWLNNYYEQFQQSVEWNSAEFGDEMDVEKRLLSKIRQQIGSEPQTKIVPIRNRKRFAWLSAAAAILILISVALWTFSIGRKSKPRATEVAVAKKEPVHDRLPGRNKAVLTLQDGSTIVLDEAGKGTIAQQGTTRINKVSDRELSYQDAAGSQADAAMPVAFNTLSTPRGGQYQVTLPDGTRVWLNSMSSIQYPTVFKGNERRVKISGEAYLEVTKKFIDGNERKGRLPFLVSVSSHADQDSSSIEVLGTRFNVMAYGDESELRTTLLEGSIKFHHAENSCLLIPGQQSQLSKDGGIRVQKEADLEQAVAWKNGYFQFKDADIKSVMRQLSRWYDIDVVYEPGVPERRFAGQMKKEAHLSSILSILSESNVHFRIDGTRLTVMR